MAELLQHAQNHSEDEVLVSLHEEGKGILVPLLTGLHELSVILLGLRRDDAWEGYLQGVCQLHEILVPQTRSYLPLFDHVLRGLFFVN